MSVAQKKSEYFRIVLVASRKNLYNSTCKLRKSQLDGVCTQISAKTSSLPRQWLSNVKVNLTAHLDLFVNCSLHFKHTHNHRFDRLSAVYKCIKTYFSDACWKLRNSLRVYSCAI